jgi:hypothetical protein
MTRRCECGKAMGMTSFRCLACARRTPAPDPTPEEIAAITYQIRYEGLDIYRSGTARRIAQGKRAAVFAPTDQEEREWRASQIEEEVGDE